MRRVKLVLIILVGLLHSREAWVSGPMTAVGISEFYMIELIENSYPIGKKSSQAAEDDRKQKKTWKTQVAQLVGVLDPWLQQQKNLPGLELQPVSLFSKSQTAKNRPHDMVEPPKAPHATEPFFMEMKTCELSQMNRSVKVRIHVKKWPPPNIQTDLEGALCSHIKEQFGRKESPAEYPLEGLDERESNKVRLTVKYQPPYQTYVRSDLKAATQKQLDQAFLKVEQASEKALTFIEKKYLKAQFRIASYDICKKENGGKEPPEIFFSAALAFGSFSVRNCFSVNNHKNNNAIMMDFKNQLYADLSKDGFN